MAFIKSLSCKALAKGTPLCSHHIPYIFRIFLFHPTSPQTTIEAGRFWGDVCVCIFVAHLQETINAYLTLRCQLKDILLSSKTIQDSCFVCLLEKKQRVLNQQSDTFDLAQHVMGYRLLHLVYGVLSQWADRYIHSYIHS